MQNIIILLIIILTSAIVIYRVYNSIFRKKSGSCNCSGCSGCDLKPNSKKTKV